jgi:geranylgeranyl pyrophosphate synthase
MFTSLNLELKKIDNELVKIKNSNPEFNNVLSYSILTNGKKIRPILVFLSYKLFNKNKISPLVSCVATTIELIHIASLIHDDLIDGAEYRRGKQTINFSLGNKISVIAGDFILSYVLYYMTKIKNTRVKEVILDAAQKMCKGELKELIFNNITLTQNEYIDIIKDKTASLFSSSCEVGALLANANGENIKNIKKFGLNIGISFQIIDDILDFISSYEDVKKSIRIDIKTHKISLPIIFAFKYANERDKKILIRSFNNTDYKTITKILNKYNTINKSIEVAKYYKEKAIEFLSNLPKNDARKELEILSENITHIKPCKI